MSSPKSVAELGVIGRAEDMHAIWTGADATLAYLDQVTRQVGGRRGQHGHPDGDRRTGLCPHPPRHFTGGRSATRIAMVPATFATLAGSASSQDGASNQRPPRTTARSSSSPDSIRKPGVSSRTSEGRSGDRHDRPTSRGPDRPREADRGRAASLTPPRDWDVLHEATIRRFLATDPQLVHDRQCG